jgi:hypothetical protein
MNNVKIFFQLIKLKETLINIKIEIKGILMSSDRFCELFYIMEIKSIKLANPSNGSFEGDIFFYRNR